MPPRRAKEMGLPAVNCPVLFNSSEQLAILLFGQLMKWLRPMVRRGDSIPLADLRDALWAVKEAWELHRDIARACGPQHLTAVPAEELDALAAGYDPLIDARELSVADKRRLQAHLAQQREIAESEDQQQPPPPAVMSAAEHDALVEQLQILARHPWEVMQDRWRDGCSPDEAPQPGAVTPPTSLTQTDDEGVGCPACVMGDEGFDWACTRAV